MKRLIVLCFFGLACGSSATVNDSDGDGISDQAEGRPNQTDTDLDGVPDYLDADSDDDGVSDRDERAAGTSRTDADTDSDGASDLVESVLGTDALDVSENPAAQGDFAFALPWLQAPRPERGTLDFQTHIQLADIYFLFDKSAPMQVEIDSVRDAVEATIGDLTCSALEDPSMRTCVPSIYSGVGQYHDPYNNLLSLQEDLAVTRNSIENINAETSISKEDFFEAVTCHADGTCGTGCTGPVGCPSYRATAVKMLVMFTNEDSDGGTLAGASSAMLDAGIEFIGVWTTSDPSLRGDMEALARSIGSFRPNGITPRVIDGAGASAATAMTLGIREVIEDAPLRVTIEAADAAGDDGDALAFIDYLEVNTSGTGACTTVSLTEDSNSDGRPDAFAELGPGTPVCWDLVPALNDIVEPASAAQVFEARLTVSGDASPLDDRRVFFVVPPEI